MAHQIVMQHVPPRMYRPAEKNHVADSETSHLLFADRGGERYLAACRGQPCIPRHPEGRSLISVEPPLDGSSPGIDDETEAAECPAVVGDGDEKACGKTVVRTDLASDKRDFSPEPH